MFHGFCIDPTLNKILLTYYKLYPGTVYLTRGTVEEKSDGALY